MLSSASRLCDGASGTGTDDRQVDGTMWPADGPLAEAQMQGWKKRWWGQVPRGEIDQESRTARDT